MLDVGTKVRIIMQKPQDIEGKKLFGSWRRGDSRWSKEIYTIETQYLCPNQPIMYEVADADGKVVPNISFVRGLLQVVN